VQGLGNEPLVEVVLDADRRRHDAAHAGRDHRQLFAEVEEDDRLVLGQDLLEPIVVFLALRFDVRLLALLQEVVDFRIGVLDAVELVGRGLG